MVNVFPPKRLGPCADVFLVARAGEKGSPSGASGLGWIFDNGQEFPGAREGLPESGVEFLEIRALSGE